MDEQIKATFDYAQESTKQLITLATGIIALMITFLTDFVKSVPPEAKPFALGSWLLYLISVFFGILTLNGLTGILTKPNPSIYKPGVRILALLQEGFFFCTCLAGQA
jgi:hypothetical protein